MNRLSFYVSLLYLLIATIVIAPQALGEPAEQTESDSKSEAAGIPEGVEGLRGLLVGALVSKDVEKGEFMVKIAQVKRVWRNNKAKNPRSAVGKTVKVEGVRGKFLDALLLVKKGEFLEFGAIHACSRV